MWTPPLQWLCYLKRVEARRNPALCVRLAVSVMTHASHRTLEHPVKQWLSQSTMAPMLLINWVHAGEAASEIFGYDVRQQVKEGNFIDCISYRGHTERLDLPQNTAEHSAVKIYSYEMTSWHYGISVQDSESMHYHPMWGFFRLFRVSVKVVDAHVVSYSCSQWWHFYIKFFDSKLSNSALISI